MLPNTSLTAMLAEGRGDKAAILYEDQVISYGLLAENVNRTANALTQLGSGWKTG